MTHVVAIISPEYIWLAADRRYKSSCIDASFLGTKICGLTCEDAIGAISYAGVGARPKPPGAPLELSEWIKRTLRGQSLPLDQTLQLLTDAALDRSMDDMIGSHTFMYTGFAAGVRVIEAITNERVFQVTPHRSDVRPVQVQLGNNRLNRHRITIHDSFVVAMLGSGSVHVRKKAFSGFQKDIARSGRSTNHALRVGARIAQVIREVSQKDPAVSPESICKFMPRHGTGHYLFYDKAGTGSTIGYLPTIHHGMAMDEFAAGIMPIMMKHFDATRAAREADEKPPEVDGDAINAVLRAIDKPPDRSF